MIITSHTNAKLKDIRRLSRKRGRDAAGRFVAEGEDLLAAAHAAGWPPVDLFCAAGTGLEGIEVEPELLDRVSGLGSGTRALGIFEERWATPSGPLCVALFGVGDPGNVGAILRSSAAFGAACVALGPGCADPFGPKAVRASMGAIFALPVARITSPAELPGTKVALAARAGEPLAGRIDGDVTLLVGAEREGLSAAVLEQADVVSHIPIQTESLNAAMAATVALYELTRTAPTP